MKSALTNIGRDSIANAHQGAFFTITHFALAYVNDIELTNNPASADMTSLLSDPVGGKSNGDYIFNIWQTPFKWDGNSRKYGNGQNLADGFGSYYRYEYDECAERNVLTCYTPGLESLPYGLKTSGTSVYGARNSTKYPSDYQGSLTEPNIPAPLKYDTSVTAPTYDTRKYSKYFPIKSYSCINSTDEGINSKVTNMNYKLELPAVTTKTDDLTYALQNAIGNFKFNRIGLYATVSTYPTDLPNTLITSIVPMADEEPILFAVIDLVNDEVCGSSLLDILKTRDDTGMAAFSFDAQITLTSVNNYPNFAGNASMYVDVVRDDATRYFLNQLENQANVSDSIMQLQLQVIQIAQYIEKISGNSTIKSMRKGFDSLTALDQNQEYFIGDSSKAIYYFDASSLRSFDDSMINTSNVIINVYNTLSDNSIIIQDGEKIQIILANLDGRNYVANNGTRLDYWSGEIIINNFGLNKENLSIIKSSTISGISSAKVTIELVFCAQYASWVVSYVNVIDESLVA